MIRLMTLGVILAATSWAQEQLPAPPNGYRWFGWSVAVDGDRIAVGAPRSGFDRGTVRIYENPYGDWILTEELAPASLTSNDAFGWSVDLDGDLLVVGAPRWDSNGTDPGQAFVFQKLGDEWPIVAHLQPSDQDWNQFGKSVSLEGDTLLVGAPRQDGAAFQSGAVFAYEDQDGDWVQAQVLTDPTGQAQDFFGYDLEHDGDRAVVGAYQADHVYPGAGAAHVLDRVDGTWTFTAELTRAAPDWNDFFGRAVSVEGEQVAVAGQDAVHVFTHDGNGGWTQTSSLLTWPVTFGHGIDLTRAQLLVGQPGTNKGMIHGFQAPGWSEYLTHSVNVSQMKYFGVSVDAGEKWVVVGAHLHGLTGSAWVYPWDEVFPPFVEVLCSCDQGPCGSSPGTGCPNSTGQGASLTFSGTTRVTADDMVLTATDLPPEQLAMIFMGGAPTGVDLGDGQLCVGPGDPGLFRYPVQGTGLGTIQLGPGFASHAESEFAEFGGALLPGDTWHFQCWYRDPLGPCGSGLNLTNSLAITFSL